jgi:Ca2+-binding RTX toxin-like protein
MKILFVIMVVFAANAMAAPPLATCNGLQPTIVGTDGDDVLIGTSGPDVIMGLDGNDIIHGMGDVDTLCGGPGDDYIDGGEPGAGHYQNNAGADWINGGKGNDELHTADYVTQPSESVIFGDGGNDRIYLWSGGYGNGNGGNDHLYQYDGDSVMSGGNGNDVLVNWDDPWAEEKFELVAMDGGNGDDVLINEDTTGETSQWGGKGHDVCVGLTVEKDGCEE